MSKNETASPSQRINLWPSPGENPPWTGHRFACEQCGATYQLGASDDCDPVASDDPAVQLWRVPPCWGNHRAGLECGFRNTIKTPRLDAGALPGAS